MKIVKRGKLIRMAFVEFTRKIDENQAKIERQNRSHPICPRSINDPSIVTVHQLIHQSSYILSLSLDGNSGFPTVNLAFSIFRRRGEKLSIGLVELKAARPGNLSILLYRP